ncbi:hypothetical protein LR004_00140, partial [Candidatus Gracilibacteria bacterium]|nr:hypothetical protein [Candidatus Gracilibacteria bacterium]
MTADKQGGESNIVTPKFGIISVYDKTGLVELGRELTIDRSMDIISTGGTYRDLKEAGVSVQEVSEYTGQEEMLDGR